MAYREFGQLWEITEPQGAWNRVNDRYGNLLLGAGAELSLKKKQPERDTEKNINKEKLEVIAYLYVLVKLMETNNHPQTATWIKELLDLMVLADLTNAEVRATLHKRFEELNPWIYGEGRWPESYPEK